LSLNLSENNANQQALTRQINDFEDRLTNRRQFLINQYSQVDAMLRQYPLILAQITGQLASIK
jgi:flagellar capping protein FliD